LQVAVAVVDAMALVLAQEAILLAQVYLFQL
jgi:hypothetical protein